LGEFFASQISGPLGADFHIGLPPSEFNRVANLSAPQWPPTDLTQLHPGSPAFKTATGPNLDLNIGNRPANPSLALAVRCGD
jgi:hypothetical protein